MYSLTGSLSALMQESKSEADALREKIGVLESWLAEAERELGAARSRINELEATAARPPTEEKLSEPTVG